MAAKAPARKKTSKPAAGDAYDASTLAKLEGLDAVRKRMGMYIGSNDSRGLQHCLWEIVDNSVDEAIAGHCSTIGVTLHADGSAEVSDNGRGIPVDIEPQSGLPGVVLVLTELHAGGKFGTGGYKVAGGLHGVGASVVNALSERLDVEVCRDGVRWGVSFRRGEPGQYGTDGKFKPGTKMARLGKVAKKTTGTSIRFWPDSALFTSDAAFDWARLVDRARQTVHLVSGVTIEVTDLRDGETATETFQAANGLADLVKHLASGTKPLAGTDVLRFSGGGHYTEQVPVLRDDEWVTEKVERDMEVDLALQWGDGYDTVVRGFVNVVDTPGGGTHITGFERAVVRTINSAIAGTKLLRANEPAPVKDDVLEGITVALAVRIAEPQFEGQTKEILGTPAARDIVASVVTEQLGAWLAAPRNRKAARAILSKIVEAGRNRRALREQRDTVRRKNALENSSLPDKLKDCRNTGLDSELILVEGDSALGSCRAARDANFQALLPLRGKILNVYRASERQMLDNAECAAIVSALGAGVGRSFDMSKLRYGRVVILCDADVDGSHIRLLLLTLFYRYMRPLVDAGRVFSAVPPLYLIPVKGGEPIYCYSDRERDVALAKLEEEGLSVDAARGVQRFKGLGEMSADQMYETTLAADRRALRRIDAADAEAAAELFDVLMGSDAGARREWISENSDLLDPAALDI